MIEHIIGGLYYTQKDYKYYLAVFTKEEQNQLISTKNYNLKCGNILLFNTTSRNILEKYTPLQEEKIKQVGNVDIDSLKKVDKRVTRYNIKKNRQMLDAILKGQKIIVVLPSKFDKKFKLSI